MAEGLSGKAIAGIIVVFIVAVVAYFLLTAPPSTYNVNTLGNPSKGSGNVTIVEFSDYECPACGALEPVVKRITSEYAGKVKLVYMDYPLGIHPFAQKAAEASECAADQGKFWEYHDKLFENQQALGSADLKGYAEQLGLDMTKFNTCLDTGAKKAEVAADYEEGGRAGVPGTPTFFVNGKKLVGPSYDQLKAAVDEALAAK
jgi:protein-disulfide isomerase